MVTGATGFIGTALCERLVADNHFVRGTIWLDESPINLPNSIETVKIKSIGPQTDWTEALTDIDIVIHLAARVHIMSDSSNDPLVEYRQVNVAGTTCLAKAAAKAGIRRMLFVSSVKVNGEENREPYTPNSLPNPLDPYGISKLEAEQVLRQIEIESGIEIVIVRPTLVYGPGVKANFLKMMRIIQSGLPLPIASVVNKRSLVYVGNLVDALVTCATCPAAAGKTFFVSDGEDVSTVELVRRVARVLNRPARLISVPLSLLRIVGAVTGKNSTINRLTGSLTVDSSKIRQELRWKPPFTMDEGLRATAIWFKDVYKTN